MSGHTQGKWVHSSMGMSKSDWRSLYAVDLQIVRNDTSRVIAAVWGGDDDGAHDTANARLIAAAPEMLEALKAMMKHSCVADADPNDKDEEDHAAERAARAAIAKATGGK